MIPTHVTYRFSIDQSKNVHRAKFVPHSPLACCQQTIRCTTFHFSRSVFPYRSCCYCQSRLRISVHLAIWICLFLWCCLGKRSHNRCSCWRTLGCLFRFFTHLRNTPQSEFRLATSPSQNRSIYRFANHPRIHLQFSLCTFLSHVPRPFSTYPSRRFHLLTPIYRSLISYHQPTTPHISIHQDRPEYPILTGYFPVYLLYKLCHPWALLATAKMLQYLHIHRSHFQFTSWLTM